MNDKPDQEKLIEEAGSALATSVLYHIDTMYPAMWNSVSQSARMSIRNTIRRRFATEFDELLKEIAGD